MRILIYTLTAAVVLAVSASGAAADPALDTDDEKAIYALGLALSRNLSTFMLTEDELPQLLAGVTDGVLARDPKVDVQEYTTKIQALATRIDKWGDFTEVLQEVRDLLSGEETIIEETRKAVQSEHR